MRHGALDKVGEQSTGLAFVCVCVCAYVCVCVCMCVTIHPNSLETWLTSAWPGPERHEASDWRLAPGCYILPVSRTLGGLTLPYGLGGGGGGHFLVCETICGEELV
jgi:hypothetical protein